MISRKSIGLHRLVDLMVEMIQWEYKIRGVEISIEEVHQQENVLNVDYGDHGWELLILLVRVQLV